MQKTLRALVALAAAAPTALAASDALAQAFPADEDWTALRCGGQVMTDPLGDEPDDVTERDLVGDGDEPAGFHAGDDDFFYLRLRVDGDPVAGAELRDDAWGMAFDVDADLQTYEILILADAVDQEIKLYQNTEVLEPDLPTDPADQPPVAVYPFEQFVQSIDAGSLFNDDADWFIDLAVPWADLDELSVRPTTTLRAWVASSTAQDRLDADFACHDGAGGAPSIGDVISDEAQADPDATDDGGDGGDDATDDGGDDVTDDGGDDATDDGGDGVPGGRELEGGGGCTAGGTAGGTAALLLLAAVAPLARRRRRVA